ncbi:MAG: IS1595 family transposase [Rhodomicrobium sp.]
MSLLNQEHLQNEEAAYAWFEARIWPEGPVCAHCKGTERISKMKGTATRIGLYKCYACRKQFNVKVGTIFEKSHVPMHVWLQAFYLIAGSKKGVSSNQLHRTLGVTLKTAWFMGHRIREAMRTGSFAAPLGGEVRSFVIDKANAANVWPIIDKNLSWESTLMTDEAALYGTIGREFKAHFTVEHGKDEYVRGTCHTNTLEGFFSIFKRGMKGVYQHCDEKHLHRYLAEFDFRYNNRIARGVNDEDRAGRMIEGAKGKRLTYRTPN